MVNIEEDLQQSISIGSRTMETFVGYLVGDLGTTRFLLGIFGLDQGEADRKDQEKGEEEVAEIHDCKLPLLCVDVMKEQEWRPACNGVRRRPRFGETLLPDDFSRASRTSVN
jgi:hypothetical protein